MKIITEPVSHGARTGADDAPVAGAGQPAAGVLRDVSRRAGPTAERVPVYRVGELTGFVRRTGQYPEAGRRTAASEPRLSSDARLRRDIAAAVQSELPGAARYIRLSVERGVVVLAGEVGNVHDKMALRRIAASMAATIAIIDDVWISCE